MRKLWGADNVLKTTCCRRGMAKADLGWWNLWWILRWHFEPVSKGFPAVKKVRRVFRRQRQRCNGTPENHPEFRHFKICFSPNENSTAILSACICRCKFRPATFFAAPIFRKCRFSPVPFFASSIFRRAHPSAALQNTNSALLPPFQKASKATPSYFCVLCRCWCKIPFSFVYHDYHNCDCVLTTHSNFRILQPKSFAGVSLCRLVSITFHVGESPLPAGAFCPRPASASYWSPKLILQKNIA